MNFNFNIQLSGLPDSGKKNLDIYFQPALSWTDSSVEAEKVQGVAMLFLENDENATSVDNQDFQEMLKILVRWVWAAFHDSESEAPTKAGLEEVYEAFATEVLSYTDLKAFLTNHLVFRIQEHVPTSELEGTVFPMFPHLGLQLGEGDPFVFPPAGNELDSTNLPFLKNFNKQFKPRFAPDENAPDTIEAADLLEYVFTGYFRLLIKSGLQKLIDTDDLKLTIKETLDEITADAADTAAVYENMAGMASTFMLNGFRMPAEVFGEAQGLYQATGQQFNLASAIKTIQELKTVTAEGLNERDIYSITLRTSSSLAYLKNKDGSNFTEIIYTIDIPSTEDAKLSLFQLSEDLKTIDADTFPPSTPAQIDWHRPQNMYFALRQSIAWQRTAGDADQLLPLPTSLRNHLRQEDPNINLRKWPRGNHHEEEPLINADFSWVSMVKFTVRRILDVDTQVFLPHTYELVEGSDDDLNRLEEIFNFLKTNTETNPFDLHLAFAPGGSTNPADLQSLEPANDANGNPSSAFLFCNNLASNTDTALAAPFVTDLKSNPNVAETAFLRMVWQGCTVANGGYFLHIDHQDTQLNTEWFAGADSAELHLIIEFLAAPDPIHPFHTAALIFEPVDLETDLLLAHSSETVPVLVIPAGHVGIRLTRDIPADPDSATAEAHNLYHMLGFGLSNPAFSITNTLLDILEQTITDELTDPAELVNFETLMTAIRSLDLDQQVFASQTDLDAVIEQGIGAGLADTYLIYKDRILANTANLSYKTAFSGMPIGPTTVGDLETATQWQYERLIPAFSLWDSPAATTNTKLPSRDQDPYLGVNDLASLPVDCWWQDIYGNSLVAEKDSLNFPIRYTDPLIGLNQWPSVQEHFHFSEGSSSDVELTLDFSFDPNPYPAPAAGGNKTAQQQKRLSADLLQYQKIYYQLIQADIKLSVTTSLDETWAIELSSVDKNLLIGFVEDIYMYLADLDANTVSIPPDYFQLSFNRSYDIEPLLKLPTAFIFAIDVSFIIERGIKQIHDDLTDDAVDGAGNPIKVMKPKHLGVLKDTARLSPRINASSSARDFAADFEEAFPDLRLAVSDDRLKKRAGTDVGRPYYAVQLGTPQGLSYNISEANPAYFALAPLSNTLMTGAVEVDNYTHWKTAERIDQYDPVVEEKQFEVIDLNVLARDFLVAIESFLEPKSLVAARQIDATKTDAVLDTKASLAEAIVTALDTILVIDQGTGNLAEAQAALKHELLTHLVKGYDIETAVQFQVELEVGNVSLTSGQVANQPMPRIRGMAVVKNVWLGEDVTQLKLANKEDLDFSLSTGAIDLLPSTGTTTFTYLFDTKTPEKFAAIHLELEFRVTEIEYEIENVPGISEFQASNWLSLVLPENLNTYQITTELIDDAKDTISTKTKDLKLLTQVLQTLDGSSEKDTEFTTDAALQTAIEAELTAEEYSTFEDLFLTYSQATHGITQSGMDRIFPQVDLDVEEQTTLLNTIQIIRDSEPPLVGVEFSAMADFTTALEGVIGVDDAVATASATIQAQVLPLFRIVNGLLPELDALLDNGEPADLQAVRDTLNISKIEDLEFLSISGFQSGLRRELGDSTYADFEDTLVKASHPVHRLDVSVLDRLEEQANVTQTRLSLFKTILLESKNGPLFEREFFSLQEFQAEVRRELGSRSYEKYKTQIEKYTQPFYQITNRRLDRLEKEYTASNLSEVRVLIQQLKSGNLVNQSFFTEGEFTTALLADIDQTDFDSFGTDLLAYCNPFRITDNLLAGLVSETGISEPDWYEQLIQDIRSDRLKDQEYITLEAFERALIDSLGGRFFGRFRTLLEDFSQAFYRMSGATLTGMEQQLNTDQAVNDRASVVVASIDSSTLKDELFFSLPDLEDAVKIFLGETSFTQYETVLETYTRSVFRMSTPRLEALRQQYAADFAALSQYEESLSLLKKAAAPIGTYLSSTDLEDALKQYLQLSPYENFLAQSPLATRLSQPVFRLSQAMLEHVARMATVSDPDTNAYDLKVEDLQANKPAQEEFSDQHAFKAALETAWGTGDFALLEPALIAADQSTNVLRDNLLDDLLAKVSVAQTKQDERSALLTELDAVSFKAQEFPTIKDLVDEIESLLLTNFDTYRDHVLAYATPYYRIADSMLSNWQDDQAAELGERTDLQSLLVGFRTLSLVDVTHDNQEALDLAISTALDATLQTHYDTYKDRLLNLADAQFQITEGPLAALEQQLVDELAALTSYGNALQAVETNAVASEAFGNIDDLEAELRTVLELEPNIIYSEYRDRLLKHAFPVFYRLEGEMLTGIETELTNEQTAWSTFKSDLEALKIIAVGDRTYTSEEEMINAFQGALSATAFNLQEQQLGWLRETLLSFTHPVFRLGTTWLNDRQTEIDSTATHLADLGAALDHLAASDFGEQEFWEQGDFENGISTELDQLAAGTYTALQSEMSSLIEPVFELFIPDDLDPSGTLPPADEEEFTALRQILEESDLVGFDVVAQTDLEAKMKIVIGDADFQFFRNVAPLFTNPNYMGKSPVPIPLRDYPTPPALIFQGAEVDESSRIDLEDIRQWEYNIIYEHEDVAQDSIDCIIELNTLDPDSLAVSARSGTPTRDLFQSLVNFNETYAVLAKDLALLRDDQLFEAGQEANQLLANQAILAFQTLVAEVNTAWTNWTPVVSNQQAASGDIHFEISEEPNGTGTGINGETIALKKGYIYPRTPMLRSQLGSDDPEPLLALPGYQQEGEPVWLEGPDRKTYDFSEDPFDETFFGDSSIPDRKFTIENLDVIEHQNAWASIWLSRNKILIAGLETNSKFIFQTPAVSFTNRISPFITNDEPWDLATLHSPDDLAQDKPLLEHMELILGLIAPDSSHLNINYEVRLSCRYAFSLAKGTGLNVDLKSTLPLLMGLRLNPTDTTASGEKLLAAYPKMLTDEIKLWLRLNDPSPQNASLLFSVNLFSKLDPNSLTSLPMLRIKHLELKLINISG